MGKTSVIQKLTSRLCGRAKGFYTEEIRKKGRRLGFELRLLTGESRVFAHVDFKSPCRVGKYGVDVSALDELGVKTIREALVEEKVIIIDEIGKMELYSRAFREVVTEVFDSRLPVVATITCKETAFTRKLKVRPGVNLIEVTHDNRDTLAEHILRMLG